MKLSHKVDGALCASSSLESLSIDETNITSSTFPKLRAQISRLIIFRMHFDICVAKVQKKMNTKQKTSKSRQNLTMNE